MVQENKEHKITLDKLCNFEKKNTHIFTCDIDVNL